jgi:protein-tyrosine phosphatase
MTPLFWIEGPWRGRLAIAARPRGGDWLVDEMNAWRHAGIDTVVSLLTSEENQDLELTREEPVCRAAGIEFVSFPIVDRSVPESSLSVARLLAQLDEELTGGKSVVIHCRQGLGRAGLIAASLLIAHEADAKRALAAVSSARGVTIPETEEQRAWVIEGVGPVRQR